MVRFRIMNYCTKCEKDKPTTDFYRRGAGFQPWCKLCRKGLDAQRYQERRLEFAERNRRRNQAVIEWGRSLKEGKPCTDCGISYHPVAMQWDHLPGTTKILPLASMARAGWSKKRILEEIAKCELVCANCHAVRTHTRRAVAQLGSAPSSGLG